MIEVNLNVDGADISAVEKLLAGLVDAGKDQGVEIRVSVRGGGAMGAKPHAVDYEALDWTKFNIDLALDTGLASATLSYHRRHLEPFGPYPERWMAKN